MKKFSLLITTKNRLAELKFTLKKCEPFLIRQDVECIICDDGSTDNTSEFIKKKYPDIKLLVNPKSRGLIYSRNLLMEAARGEFAISLDDDAHFLTDDSLEQIESFFNKQPNCAVASFRLFWSKQAPISTKTNIEPKKVFGFAGGAHAWQLKHWKKIKSYPDWFVFYGEEDFASYELIKKQLEIWYLPNVLIQHRVNLKERKNNKDYITRTRRGLRAGWFLMLMYYPKRIIQKRFIYSVWKQFETKILKGDLEALIGMFLAWFDLLYYLPKVLKNINRFSVKDFLEISNLPKVPLYWKPEDG